MSSKIPPDLHYPRRICITDQKDPLIRQFSLILRTSSASNWGLFPLRFASLSNKSLRSPCGIELIRNPFSAFPARIWCLSPTIFPSRIFSHTYDKLIPTTNLIRSDQLLNPSQCVSNFAIQSNFLILIKTFSHFGMFLISLLQF